MPLGQRDFYGSTTGKLIASIKMPEGKVGKGQKLGEVSISETGEVTVNPGETYEEWKNRTGHDR